VISKAARNIRSLETVGAIHELSPQMGQPSAWAIKVLSERVPIATGTFTPVLPTNSCSPTSDTQQLLLTKRHKNVA